MPDLALKPSTESADTPNPRVLFVSQTMDRAEVDLVLRLHAGGVFVRALTSVETAGRDALAQKGLYIQSVRYRTKMSRGLTAQIVSLVRLHGINVVHATDTKSLANALWASYFCDIAIAAYRGTASRIRRSDPGYRLGILHPRVAKIFCVSEAVRSYLEQFVSADKLVLNYKGYDPAWIEEWSPAPLPADLVPADALVAMHIGNARGRPHKGLNFLVEAFHRLDEPRAHLVVIGNYGNDIEDRVSRGAAARRIHLLGQLDDAARFLANADVYVQPSLLEGLPRAVKEAMAQGIAPILTNIPSLAEMIIDGESGILVNAGDPQDLAAALGRLFADPELRKALGANARRRLRERFSPEAYFNTTLAVYRDLASEGSRTRRTRSRGRR